MHIIHPFTTTSTYNHTYLTNSIKTDIYHFIHRKKKNKIITSYVIMSKHVAIWQGGWKSPDGVP